MSTSSINGQIRRFHVVVMQWTSKKCSKKRDARAELLCRRLRHLRCLSSLLTHIVHQTQLIDKLIIDNNR